ncbi:MAG: cysteine desulfurase [Clostridia bacterium]|nr:cysteine desulfurase [Clostridia bacterium]
MNAYLDNSATTPPGEAVAALTRELLESGWYNPSALYRPAMEIQKKMELVRTACLKAAGAEGGRVVFTSGGTESDNLALLGHMKTQRTPGLVLISSVEHPAVSACAEALEQMGHRVMEIPAGPDGTADLGKLAEMMKEKPSLISVMQVNNETGAAEPLEEIAGMRNRLCPDTAIHVDGVQGFLRMPVHFRKLGIQSYALSAHKIHGLKGTGALILADRYPIRPILYGGGQEGNLRSGTENTLGILALGAAVESWQEEDCARMRRLKIRLWQQLKERIPEAEVNGPDPEDGAPHILNVAFRPVRSQTLLFALEGDGIYVSAGSACASRKQKISPVLKAMGMDPARADCSLRFSLSRETREEEIDYAAERTAFHYETLKKYTRR